jgi:DNA-binding response OmpR family regulator
MVLGDETMVRRLSVSLAGEGVELVRAVTPVGEGKFDVVLVDSVIGGAEAACHYIKQVSSIPVVLMVRARQADWQRLQALDADAYVPEGVGGAELAARLRAVVRRRSAENSVEKEKGRQAIGSNQLE